LIVPARAHDEMGYQVTATSADEPAIRVHGLTTSYSGLEVLRVVDFEVAPRRTSPSWA
jgi:hypothetical protein